MNKIKSIVDKKPLSEMEQIQKESQELIHVMAMKRQRFDLERLREQAKNYRPEPYEPKPENSLPVKEFVYSKNGVNIIIQNQNVCDILAIMQDLNRFTYPKW